MKAKLFLKVDYGMQDLDDTKYFSAWQWSRPELSLSTVIEKVPFASPHHHHIKDIHIP